MAAFVLVNAKSMYDGRDLSGITRQVALNSEVDLQEVTTFGDTFRRRAAGLFSVDLSAESYWESLSGDDSSDSDMFGLLNAGKKLVSVAGEGGNVADVGYMFEGDLQSYNVGAPIGELYKANIALQGNDKLMRGQVMENGTRTATGNGTAVQVGAVSSTQTIWSGLHVVAASGTSPTLDVTVESDDASGFATTVLRFTHAQHPTV